MIEVPHKFSNENEPAHRPLGDGRWRLCWRKRIVLACGLIACGLIASASLNSPPAAAREMSARDWAETHKCSVRGFRSAKEYNSSSWPWYTYSTCMTESGEKP
jgi:hypothetical protein